MPYKDPERKKEWERLHRPHRLARRRELRRSEAAQQQPRHETPRVEVGPAALLVPVIVGGAVATYSPKIGMAIGGVTLVSSAVWKKGWAWWLLGCVILVVALLSYWSDQQASETEP